MTEMKYKVGQEVVIRRNLGQMHGYKPGEYYYGGNLEEVPLGTKATIEEIFSKEQIYVRLGNEKYGNTGWYVHPSEIDHLTKEQAQAEKERQKQGNSQLEEILLNSVQDTKDKTRTRTKKKSFNPAFNVREEFAVWVRQEFPRLKQYAKSRKGYSALTRRKAEVMEGARMAYEHAKKTTDSCVTDAFQEKYNNLECSDGMDFPRHLCQMVKYIEHVSANLGKSNHYGTRRQR